MKPNSGHVKLIHFGLQCKSDKLSFVSDTRLVDSKGKLT
jgi:hypothetical protein